MPLEKSDREFFDGLYALARKFEPTAYFDTVMDQLIFVRSNDVYRAERVDPYLTLLWHATERELIGVKIKGFRDLFERLKELGQVTEDQFLPLCEFISGISGLYVVGDFPEDGKPLGEFPKESYHRAIELVGDYKYDRNTRLAA